LAEFDPDECAALDIPVTPAELQEIYKVIINEMILIRRLTKD